ncbi:helicase [Saccharibacillus sacchari]|uniref:Helicase n=1 Tax=Saccharibacillus sacchari TaxID=456493 RepID=A0ACC6P5W1_9BACL
MNQRKNEKDSGSPGIRRTVEIGGVSKKELLQQLSTRNVSLNAYAEQLFADERFTTSEVERTLLTVERSVEELGFPEGATLPQVFEQASKLGFAPCPLELAVHLRLRYTDQEDGGSASVPGSNQAPARSITIASEPLSEDDEVPKGFYLRKIEGTLWLRGYRCDAEHVWQGEDRFVFALTP